LHNSVGSLDLSTLWLLDEAIGRATAGVLSPLPCLGESGNFLIAVLIDGPAKVCLLVQTHEHYSISLFGLGIFSPKATMHTGI
jgi:hypothetical protein